jgi:Transport and Golgi organisation 2
MCTVSVLRAPWVERDVPRPPRGNAECPLVLPSWRVVVNRDERKERALAEPPLAASYDGVRAVHPVDPVGGGTWVAATDAGLVFALLNEPDRVPMRPAEAAPLSRGVVIPLLLSSHSAAEAAGRLDRIPVSRFRPFRLLVVSAHGVLEALSYGTVLEVVELRAQPTFVRTSSSVEPFETARRRTALFEWMVPEPSIAAQDRFHRHRWPLAPGASVLMARPEAETVSVTTVDVFARQARLAYRALPAGPRCVTELARAA